MNSTHVPLIYTDAYGELLPDTYRSQSKIFGFAHLITKHHSLGSMNQYFNSI